MSDEKLSKLPKLSAIKKKFVKEYLIDLNATKAAIRAGYAKKSARSKASQLLAEVNISKHLEREFGAREERTEITQDRVLQELAALGFSRLNDFANWGEGSLSLIPSEELSDTNTAAVESVEETFSPESGSKVKIKLHNKIKSLELIGKHLGMFNYEPEPIERNRDINADRIRSSIRRTRERFEKRGKSESKKGTGKGTK